MGALREQVRQATARQVNQLLLAWLLIPSTAVSAESLWKCEGRWDQAEGKVVVAAENLEDRSLRWGYKKGREVNRFVNEISCLTDDNKAIGCELAPPARVDEAPLYQPSSSKAVLPENCRVFLATHSRRCEVQIADCPLFRRAKGYAPAITKMFDINYVSANSLDLGAMYVFDLGQKDPGEIRVFDDNGFAFKVNLLSFDFVPPFLNRSEMRDGETGRPTGLGRMWFRALGLTAGAGFGTTAAGSDDVAVFLFNYGLFFEVTDFLGIETGGVTGVSPDGQFNSSTRDDSAFYVGLRFNTDRAFSFGKALYSRCSGEDVEE